MLYGPCLSMKTCVKCPIHIYLHTWKEGEYTREEPIEDRFTNDFFFVFTIKK